MGISTKDKFVDNLCVSVVLSSQKLGIFFNAIQLKRSKSAFLY